MKNWRRWGLGVALAVTVAWTPAWAGGSCLSGVITNWYQVKSKVSGKGYFQFVRKQEKLSSNSDKEGLSALVSNLPRLDVKSSGGFQGDVADLPPGEYFIALQRGLTSAPIVVKDGNPLLIKVPGKFPLNVGNVKLEMPLGHTPPRHHMEVVK